MFVIMVVVCVLFAVFLIRGIRLRSELVEGDETRMELLREIAAEEERSERADEARAYMESEEFIKQTAREKLGLIAPDEIIFKAQE